VSPEPIDPEVTELAGRVFDLARGGHTEELVAYVDAGVPVNLTNDKGDTLLLLAAYHDHPATVAALFERGPIMRAPTTAVRPRSPRRCSGSRQTASSSCWPPAPTPTEAVRAPGPPPRSSTYRR
jgi:hypothetical protein